MNNNKIIEFISEKFEEYCQEENYTKIKEYLYKFKELSNYNNGYFFEIIADKGNLDLIKLFVENGANINIDNNYVLFTCAYNNHYDCVNYLLSKGANIENIKTTCGYKNAVKIYNNFLTVQ